MKREKIILESSSFTELLLFSWIPAGIMMYWIVEYHDKSFLKENVISLPTKGLQYSVYFIIKRLSYSNWWTYYVFLAWFSLVYIAARWSRWATPTINVFFKIFCSHSEQYRFRSHSKIIFDILHFVWLIYIPIFNME